MISWSYRRPVKFDDLVSFIDRKARIATNPVFGQITESSKILEARSIRGTVQKLLLKSRELSLAAQVNTDHGLDTELAIERCLKPANFGRIVSSQLHHFSDASEIGFGLVSYLRLSDDPEVKVDVNVRASVAAVPVCPVVEYFRRMSSWHRLKKSVARYLRYCENLQFASTHRKLAVYSPNTPCRRINMEEMKAAELQIL
ncbi:hypothetical protein P5673_015279, partial [Acropora cervicornis]